MKNKFAWLEATLVLAPFGALAILWNQIPARVPIHWNLRGEVDDWASKPIGPLLLPVTSLLTVALCHVVSWLDPKLRRNLEKTDRMNKVLQIFRLSFAALFAAVFAVQLAVAFGYRIAADRMIPWCILILFAILGNYLPNLRPNYFVGIRTPWTLESPETWRATHRLGGRLMFFGSLLLFVLGFVVSAGVFAALFVILILLLVLWSLIYSWHHYRTHATTREML